MFWENAFVFLNLIRLKTFHSASFQIKRVARKEHKGNFPRLPSCSNKFLLTSFVTNVPTECHNIKRTFYVSSLKTVALPVIGMAS